MACGWCGADGHRHDHRSLGPPLDHPTRHGRRPLRPRGFQPARGRPRPGGDHARRGAARGPRRGPRRRAADAGVRARILPADGGLPLSADPAARPVGPRRAHGLLRPAWPRPIRRGRARDLHADPARQGPADRAERGGAPRNDRAGGPLDGRHDGVVARPPVPRTVRAPNRGRRADFLGGRRCGEITTGRDPEKPCAGSGPGRSAVRAEPDAPRPQRIPLADRPGAARRVLQRSAGQPEPGRVLAADDEQHADTHHGGVSGRVGKARRNRRAVDTAAGPDPDRLRGPRPADPGRVFAKDGRQPAAVRVGPRRSPSRSTPG